MHFAMYLSQNSLKSIKTEIKTEPSPFALIKKSIKTETSPIDPIAHLHRKEPSPIVPNYNNPQKNTN